MSKRKRHHDDGPGQDSFLDIVANIVGILIILIMVVGVRAKTAWVKQAEQVPAPIAPRKVTANNTRAAADVVEQEVIGLQEKTRVVAAEILQRLKERELLQTQVQAHKLAIDERQAELEDDARQAFELNQQRMDLARQLDAMDAQAQAISLELPKTEILKHIPTPLAETVFGFEEHFRLLGGKLARVPLNELVDRLKNQWKDKLWKLEDAPQFTDTIGPVDGWRMQYTIRKRMVTVRGPQGTTMPRQRAELSGFVLVPVASQMGEPLEKALKPGSEFRRRLAVTDPNRTTITIWTYPDSYGEFRNLKDDLYEAGFLTAGRPLPEGFPISGSPSGTRSVAQ